MGLYIKGESYTLSTHGVPLAFIVKSIHMFTFKQRAQITLQNGQKHELYNQWDDVEQFDFEIDTYVKRLTGIL